MLNIVSTGVWFVTLKSVHEIHQCNHLNETSFAKLLAGVVHFFVLHRKKFGILWFFFTLATIHSERVYKSVMCSAIKSFILLSSFRGINFISLSKQDCLIYFNYWNCLIHETMTSFFLKVTVLFSISQIVDTKLTINIRVMKMLGKWNQKSGLLTELWIKLSTVKRFYSVAVKPKNSQTCYKGRNIQIFQNSEHLSERTDSSFFCKAFLAKKILSFVHVMTCHGSCQH